MAAPQPLPSGPGLADLPDDLLVACFARLDDPLERRRVLPLVCSRWRRLADQPQLVRSFSLELPDWASLPRLTAFCRWLEQSGAGAAVRSLRLVASPSPDWRQKRNEERSYCEQLHSDLLCIKTACSGLRELCVASSCRMPDTEVCSLAGGLPSLRLLHLQLPYAELLIETPLDGLSQLQDLRVDCLHLWVDDDMALPPALTRLHLGDFEPQSRMWDLHLIDPGGYTDLPPPISSLCQLEQLRVSVLMCEPEEWSPLSCLTSLTTLALTLCRHLPPPAVLLPLSRLRELLLHECYSDDAAQFSHEAEEALESLPQLTALRLGYMHYVPQTAAGLTQLQLFAWDGYVPDEWQGLPGGPWLASLRKALLPGNAVASDLSVLQQATRLEHLALLTRPGYSGLRRELTAPELVEVVGQHPSLRCLQLGGPQTISETDAAAIMEQLPHLSVLLNQRLGQCVRAVTPQFA